MNAPWHEEQAGRDWKRWLQHSCVTSSMSCSHERWTFQPPSFGQVRQHLGRATPPRTVSRCAHVDASTAASASFDSGRTESCPILRSLKLDGRGHGFTRVPSPMRNTTCVKKKTKKTTIECLATSWAWHRPRCTMSLSRAPCPDDLSAVVPTVPLELFVVAKCYEAML